MKCCWRSLATEDRFAPRIVPNEWPSFADWLAAELLDDTPHRHYVFAIPQLLRQHFLFDRRLQGFFVLAPMPPFER
jgi:hypothetical protein